MNERVEEIRRRMRKIGTVFIQDGNGYHVVQGQEEAASFLADAAWTLSGALAQAERRWEEHRTCVDSLTGAIRGLNHQVDALQAKVAQAERERDVARGLFEELHTVRVERDEARAEVERLKKGWLEEEEVSRLVQESQANVTRLKAESQFYENQWHNATQIARHADKRATHAEAAIARVREALGRELGLHRASCFGPPCETCARLEEARAALEGLSSE